MKTLKKPIKDFKMPVKIKNAHLMPHFHMVSCSHYLKPIWHLSHEFSERLIFWRLHYDADRMRQFFKVFF